MVLKQRQPKHTKRTTSKQPPPSREEPLEQQPRETRQVPAEITFRCKKRALESVERRMDALKQRSFRIENQSVMARHRTRGSAGRHHDRLTTIAGLVIGFIGCFLLAAIISSPCVQADDRAVASPSVLSANYYKAVESVSEEDGEGASDGYEVDGSDEDLVQDDHDFVEVGPRSKSVGDSAIRNKAEENDADQEQGGDSSAVHDDVGNEQLLVAATSPKSVRTAVRSSSGSENGILPKFGDRISPRKLKKNSPATQQPAPVAVQQQQSDYYAPENGLAAVNAREGRSGIGFALPVVYPAAANAVISPSLPPVAVSNLWKSTTNPLSDSVANSNIAEKARKDAVKLSGSSSISNNNQEVHRLLTDVDALPVLLNENQVNNQNVSSAQAHRLEMSTEFFVVPPVSTPLPLKTKSTTRRPNGGMLILAKEGKRSSFGNSRSAAASAPTITASPVTPMSGLRKEPWVVPVLVLATLSMFMMAAFEVFVLCKAWRTSPSRRHLFLGQMLLLGLFSCAGLAAILTVTPTLLSCATVRFGAGVAFALVFASLLVKCVFLISLNGGVYLPAPYQGLLLLFAVLIQIAVGSQWLLTSPPAVDTISAPSTSSHSIFVNRNASLLLPPTSLVNHDKNSSYVHPLDVTSFAVPTIALCRTQFSELLFSLIYVVFLILFVAVLAIKSRGIRDNYREATYIGLAIGGSIPIWLGWTLCGLAVAERHRDACLAFGLIATSTTVFLVMFMPKGRQLAAMGKEGLYVEDREERFSSLSRAGSGYSPSFFHFKPIKYGVMGNANSPSNTNPSGMGLGSRDNNNLSSSSNNNNNNNSSSNNGNSSSMTKHQAMATLGGGEFFLRFSRKIFGAWLSLSFPPFNALSGWFIVLMKDSRGVWTIRANHFIKSGMGLFFFACLCVFGGSGGLGKLID